MLLVVCPFFSGDLPLAESLMEWIGEFGGVANYPCLLVYPEDTDSSRVHRLAAAAFKSVETLPLQNVPTGWPQGPNIMFKRTAEHLMSRNVPWLFLETDALPTRQTWLREIDAAYRPDKAPFMGALREKKYKQNGQWVRDGNHMVGMGVYPADFFANSDLIHVVGRDNEPYDYKLSGEVARRGCFNSELFSHHWHTTNWRVEDGKLVADQKNVDAQCDPFDLRGPAVVHGVKDGSAMELLRNPLALANWNLSQLVKTTPHAHVPVPQMWPLDQSKGEADTVAALQRDQQKEHESWVRNRPQDFSALITIEESPNPLASAPRIVKHQAPVQPVAPAELPARRLGPPSDAELAALPVMQMSAPPVLASTEPLDTGVLDNSFSRPDDLDMMDRAIVGVANGIQREISSEQSQSHQPAITEIDPEVVAETDAEYERGEALNALSDSRDEQIKADYRTGEFNRRELTTKYGIKPVDLKPLCDAVDAEKALATA